MKRRHHTPEQIVPKFREADRMLGETRSQVEVCKPLVVMEQTYCRWRDESRLCEAMEGVGEEEHPVEADRG